MVEWHRAWAAVDFDQAHRERLRLLAWCARYGRQSIDVLLHTDSSWLREWADELGKIVKEENSIRPED